MTTTKEIIQSEINSRLTSVPTQIEGGTIQDIVGSVSYELANIIDTMIEPILDNAFVSTADEDHLKIRGEELGIYRKQATYAVVKAKITNASPNITIENDVCAETEGGIVFRVVTETLTDEEGEAEVLMQALTIGKAGNIKANTLDRFSNSYAGLENARITNPKDAYNGFDIEDVEEYRERILEYMRNNACNSNIADYIMWAKSVAGVKDVVVSDATTAGEGNVFVYISATDNQEVSLELLEEVENKIKKEQIINAKLKVFPLEYFQINVRGKVALKAGANLESIRENFENILESYLSTNPKTISYLYISNLLFETEGVEDVIEYWLNEGQTSLLISNLQIPVIGNIEFEID